MTVQRVLASEVLPQPWRNGGGQTRELLCWPNASDWSVRVSLADIAVDGPFSAFPGIARWFAVIEGAGVRLDFSGREQRLRFGDAPLRFDGADAPGCTLLDGPTRDLNLMARGGESVMHAVLPDEPWQAPFAWRALFTATAGRWTAGEAQADLPAHTLLWSDDAGTGTGPWKFEPTGSPAIAGWWLSFAARP